MQGAASSTWHLEMIEVFSEAMNRRFYFDCNSWLGGGKQETVLAALSNDPKASKSTYKV